jgi:hypothetical protein
MGKRRQACQKKIFAYTKTLPTSGGPVQLQDKVVVRFALAIYPYSFGEELEVKPSDSSTFLDHGMYERCCR